jgi:1,4-alpha-glucan branching enzyme
MNYKKTIFLILSLALFSCGSQKATQINPSGLKPGIYKNGQMVTFVYPATETNVQNVAITGDFNSWNIYGIPMTYMNGVWVVLIQLEYGIYQYKYILNGDKMIADPYAEGYSPDGKGGKNSFVEVKK